MRIEIQMFDIFKEKVEADEGLETDAGASAVADPINEDLPVFSEDDIIDEPFEQEEVPAVKPVDVTSHDNLQPQNELAQPNKVEGNPAAELAKVREEAKPKAVTHEMIGYLGDEVRMMEKTELSPEEKRAKDLADCRRYMRNEDILWGTVFGVKKMAGVFCLEAIWNGIIVNFTKSSYFEPEFRFGDRYDTMNNEEKLNREIALARYQEGATIPFCISSATIGEIPDGEHKGEKCLFVVGDKVKAMAKLRDHYFLKTNNPVKVGDVADAHVLAVRDDWALVECCGCEYRLDAYSLNDKFVDNCADWVKPGNKIKVRFRKVHINPDGTVRIAVTGRMLASPETISRIVVGSSYLGTVDGYNSYKKHYNVVLLNGVTAVIPAAEVMMGRSLTIGDRVTVKVKVVLDTHVICAAVKV